jgi:hypothetical protein
MLDNADYVNSDGRTHLGRVMSELGLRDRVHAVVFAYDHGLVHPGERIARDGGH